MILMLFVDDTDAFVDDTGAFVDDADAIVDDADAIVDDTDAIDHHSRELKIQSNSMTEQVSHRNLNETEALPKCCPVITHCHDAKA